MLVIKNLPAVKNGIFTRFLLFQIAEGTEFILTVTPVRLDFHEQFEEDALVKELLDVFSGLHTDLLDFASLMTDDDALLGITLDIDDGHDMD